MSLSDTPPPGVPWQDLTGMSRADQIREVTLPLPWLALSLGLYASPIWYLGPLASFMFFLCALRLNHEAIHGNLGLSRRADGWIMHGLSALMLGSNHADAWCHLRHHRFAMGPEDHEGHCAHMSLGQVLLYGPRFPYDLNRAVLTGGSARWKRRVGIDWLCVGLFLAAALWLNATFLWLHVAAMSLAQCLTALFAVWITHQGTEASGLAGRSQRGVLSRLAYLMFYHREHHLFPAVPVHRLPDLAARLDRMPGYARTRLPVVPWLDQSAPDQ